MKFDSKLKQLTSMVTKNNSQTAAAHELSRKLDTVTGLHRDQIQEIQADIIMARRSYTFERRIVGLEANLRNEVKLSEQRADRVQTQTELCISKEDALRLSYNMSCEVGETVFGGKFGVFKDRDHNHYNFLEWKKNCMGHTNLMEYFCSNGARLSETARGLRTKQLSVELNSQKLGKVIERRNSIFKLYK